MKSSTYECRNCHKVTPKGYSKLNLYCSNSCQQAFQAKQKVDDWLAGKSTWKLQIRGWAKRYLKETRGDVCEVCGISSWNGKPLSLECDHIDGNPHNNVPTNLRLICPNCHSQTETYKAKNMGNGRKGRYS